MSVEGWPERVGQEVMKKETILAVLVRKLE